MRFLVLGPVRMETADGVAVSLTRRRERCLLAILLLAAGRVVSTDRLCGLLWEDNPPAQARAALRSQVAHIRGALARAGADQHGVDLISQRGGYLLRVEPDRVDAHRFRTLLDQATDTPDPHERDRLLCDALALWHGPALYQAATDQLRHRLCADLDELRLHAVEESIATGLELGRHRQLLPELARLNAEHPVRERLVELHMLALHRHGRTAEALDVYHHARTRLADELGLDPGPALQQLHTAILRGETLPAPRPTSGPGRDHTRITPAQLPADVPAFAGRADHLRELDALLAGPDARTAVVISAIAGTAGVGKTSLAVHWAHRVRHRFPDGQLYLNLRGFDPAGHVMTPAEAVRRFLDALQVPPARIPANVDAQLDLYRSLLADKHMLIVLDNARDTAQVRALLPGAPGCQAVVTSRNQLTGLVATGGAHPITLDLLTAEEARELLTRRLGPGRTAAEPGAVEEIITACARLPLALAIAAARAATRPQLPLATLAGELRDARSRLDTLTGDDPHTDLRAVFSWSYRALTPDAARLLRLLSLHPGPDTTAPAAASLTAVSPARVRPLLDELTHANLLTEHTPGRYILHDLLRAYATDRSRGTDADAERRAAIHRILDHYLHTAYAADRLLEPSRDPITLAPPAPGVEPEHLTDLQQALTWLTAEHSVLLAAVDHADRTGFDTITWKLAWALATYLYRQGHWHAQVHTQQAALNAADRLTDPTVQARAHHGLADAYNPLQQFDDAHTHLRHALDLYRQIGDQTWQAHTHYSLAAVHMNQGHHTDAREHCQQALDLYRAADHLTGQADALNGLGWLHSQVGDHQEALTYCQEALTLAQRVGKQSGEAATWNSIGYIHHQLNQHTQAADSYQRALDLYRDDGNRYWEANTLTGLGDTHHAAGDVPAARAAYQQALAILDDLDHPEADAVRTKLATLTSRG